MARRKHHKPTDPAEAARLAYEKRRKGPEAWGVNEEAIAMQDDVASIPEERGKTRRVFRFDCFATLKMPDHDLAAVRRLETLLAIRYRVDGKPTGAGVDSSGSAELVTARSLAAGDEIDAVTGWANHHDAQLILALLTPQVVESNRVNWHDTVKRLRGHTDRDKQAKAVKNAAAALVSPFARWDDGERPVKMARAA